MKLRILLYSYDNREAAQHRTINARSIAEAATFARSELDTHREACTIGCYLDSWTVDYRSTRTDSWEVKAHGRLADERAA